MPPRRISLSLLLPIPEEPTEEEGNEGSSNTKETGEEPMDEDTVKKLLNPEDNEKEDEDPNSESNLTDSDEDSRMEGEGPRTCKPTEASKGNQSKTLPMAKEPDFGPDFLPPSPVKDSNSEDEWPSPEEDKGRNKPCSNNYAPNLKNWLLQKRMIRESIKQENRLKEKRREARQHLQTRARDFKEIDRTQEILKEITELLMNKEIEKALKVSTTRSAEYKKKKVEQSAHFYDADPRKYFEKGSQAVMNKMATDLRKYDPKGKNKALSDQEIYRRYLAMTREDEDENDDDNNRDEEEEEQS
ncbi:hypothetical protein IE53DRAFT_363715 [Violaceomyces palustris]|uniref:Uncharacterized protein n=1 Tax=Violaceomyces palustris TaxID=1673888 RepID=A0ACD0NS67_9BASI|nr:hypothetical protein IE53DRAFT_363715 [Violaceomyces palustris]